MNLHILLPATGFRGHHTTDVVCEEGCECNAVEAWSECVALLDAYILKSRAIEYAQALLAVRTVSIRCNGKRLGREVHLSVTGMTLSSLVSKTVNMLTTPESQVQRGEFIDIPQNR